MDSDFLSGESPDELNGESMPDKPTITRREELLDDFIRNFFVQKQLLKSLEAFQVSESGLNAFA